MLLDDEERQDPMVLVFPKVVQGGHEKLCFFFTNFQNYFFFQWTVIGPEYSILYRMNTMILPYILKKEEMSFP